MSGLHPLAESFASVAEEYERGRPDYPQAAVGALAFELGLLTDPPARVLDLGAGTGKLTRELPLHREIGAIIDPYRGNTPSHHRGEWREPVASSGLFAGVGELELGSDQELDVDGVVDRVCSTSFIAALDERGRADVLGRVRDLAAGWAGPLRLGYTTEAYVYERA